MKKLLVITAALLFSTAAYAQQGERSLGVSFNYGTEIESLGIGVKFNYNATDQLRLAPNFTYFIKKDYVSMWDINFDLQYLFPVAPYIKVYPIGGFSVASAKAKYGSFKHTETKFGINLGGGVEFELTDQWAINFDLKYRIMSEIDQGIIGIGLAYKF